MKRFLAMLASFVLMLTLFVGVMPNQTVKAEEGTECTVTIYYVNVAGQVATVDRKITVTDVIDRSTQINSFSGVIEDAYPGTTEKYSFAFVAPIGNDLTKANVIYGDWSKDEKYVIQVDAIAKTEVDGYIPYEWEENSYYKAYYLVNGDEIPVPAVAKNGSKIDWKATCYAKGWMAEPKTTDMVVPSDYAEYVKSTFQRPEDGEISMQWFTMIVKGEEKPVPVKTDVLVGFHYLKADGTNGYFEKSYDDVEMTTKEFYASVLAPEVEKITDIQKDGLKAWTGSHFTYGTENAQWAPENIDRLFSANSYTGYDFVDYYAIYEGRGYAYFSYGLTHGKDENGEPFYLDSGTGFEFIKSQSEDQHDAIMEVAHCYSWLNDYVNAYGGKTSLRNAATEQTMEGWLLEIEAPVVEGETVVSPSESIIFELDGSEKRQIRCEDSVTVVIKGDTGVIPSGASFHQSYLNSGDLYDKAVAAVYSNYNETKTMAAIEFDLMTSDNQAISQLDGYVEVTLPVPSILKNASQITVFRVEGNGLIPCETKIVNGQLVFATNHFSTYVAVDTSSEAASGGSSDVPVSVQTPQQEQTPVPESPKTGDHSNDLLWIALMACAGLAGLTMAKKVKRA